MASLVRPIGAWAMLPLLLFLGVAWAEKPRQAAAAALVAGAACLGVMAPWLARNWSVQGRPSLSTAGPFNLLFLTVARMEQAPDDPGGERARDALRRECAERSAKDGNGSKRLTAFEQADGWRRVAAEHIAARPAAFLRSFATGVISGLGALGSRDFAELLGLQPVSPEDLRVTSWGERALRYRELKGETGFLLAGLVAVWLGVVWLGALAGLFGGLRRYDAAAAALPLVFCGLFVCLLGFAGNFRLRVPCEPWLAALSGMGWSWLLERVSAFRSRSG